MIMMKAKATEKQVQAVLDAVVNAGQHHSLVKLETGPLISVDDDGTLDPDPFEKLAGVREVLSIKVNLPKPTPLPVAV